MHTALLLNHDSMGHGDPALGRKILGVFLRKIPSIQQVEAIMMVNSGVKLVAPDSPVLAELRALEEHGVDLMPCGTCVEAFGVQVAAGEVSNMDDIVAELGRADKVITL
jgi:DsrE/DsrF-like family